MIALQSVTRIGIIGMGLIGGSIAAGLRSSQWHGKIYAWDHKESNLAQARALNYIDQMLTDPNELLLKADLIILATPIAAQETWFEAIKSTITQRKKPAIVTDVASVKQLCQNTAITVFGDLPPWLVLAHPIAGSDQKGVAFASNTLFKGFPVIITPHPQADSLAIKIVSALWQLLGAHVSYLTAEQHDHRLALTSHLPHLLASAFMQQTSQQLSIEQLAQLTGGGFRDFTRIAAAHSELWQQIFLANQNALQTVLDQYIQILSQWRHMITNRHAEQLQSELTQASLARQHYQQQMTLFS